MSRPGIAIVVSGFPRLSETFAAHEVAALAGAGMLAGFFATKPGEGDSPAPAEGWARTLRVLPAADPDAQGDWVAHALADTPVAAVHGYFAHAPAEVAESAARRLGIPYGFSVHARDARKVPTAELVRRGREAACVVACNADVAEDLRACGLTPTIAPHGVDLSRFSVRPCPDGRALRLLAVGRLVPKKGFDVLLRAAARVRVDARWTIVGEGPERRALESLARDLGVQARVTFAGALPHGSLPDAYAAADAVVVPSVVAADGDRDGLPNVLLEAMASGRPVVASDVSAIATAIEHGQTGLLAPAGDAVALAGLVESLTDPHLRRELGRRARERVEKNFDLRSCTKRFCAVLEAAYA